MENNLLFYGPTSEEVSKIKFRTCHTTNLGHPEIPLLTLLESMAWNSRKRYETTPLKVDLSRKMMYLT
jgi:hypothetical protein